MSNQPPNPTTTLSNENLERLLYIKKRDEEFKEYQILENKVQTEILNSISYFGVHLKSHSANHFYENLFLSEESALKIESLKSSLDDYYFLLKTKLERMSNEIENRNSNLNNSKSKEKNLRTIKQSPSPLSRDRVRRLSNNLEINLFDKCQEINALSTNVKDNIINEIYLPTGS